MAEPEDPPITPPPEEPPPEEPAAPAVPMLSAAIYGAPGATGPVTIARSGGTDAEFAALFDRCAAQMRGTP